MRWPDVYTVATAIATAIATACTAHSPPSYVLLVVNRLVHVAQCAR